MTLLAQRGRSRPLQPGTAAWDKIVTDPSRLAQDMKRSAPVPVPPLLSPTLILRTRVGTALLLAPLLWSPSGHTTSLQPDTLSPPPRLASSKPATMAKAGCANHGTAPVSEEERLLLSPGARKLTGRSQRKGSTYVAEATSRAAGGCAKTTVQLYLFRAGRFIGPATPYSLPAKTARFESFSLVDPEHLRYVVADSAASDSRCVRIHSRRPTATTTLINGTQGWTLHMDVNASVSCQARTAPSYPRDAQGHFNQGTVLLHVTVNKDGFPTGVRVTRGSSHPELDQRAIASLRAGCFDPAKPSVDVPVRFAINHL